MRWFIKLAVVRNIIAILIAPCIWAYKIISKWLSPWLGPMHAAWMQLPKPRRRFVGNFIVGITIAVMLHFTHHTGWVSQTENLAMDSMMFINQDTPRMTTGTSTGEALPFTFIDIDEDTYRTWSEPFHIPRDKLLQLIQFAADGGAKIIVVDVELSKASDNDVGLLAFLQEYNENYPPLFLVRNFYPKSKDTDQKDFQIRPSFLNEKIPNENIHWAQPIFKLSTYDHVVRYWHILKMGCLNDQPTIIPSFQLLIDAYLSTPNSLQILTDQLKLYSPPACADIEKADKSLHGELIYADKRIELDRDSYQRIGERIIYTLPWKKTTELMLRPAHRITETEPLSNQAVHDRIVVIGASYSDSRDLYKTPLGEMPGAMIIINAIKSLHQYGQIQPPPLIVKGLLVLTLIILMSLAFSRFNSLPGAIVSSIGIVFFVVPVSFYFFKYGLWIDFAVPLLGMQFHQLVVELRENTATHQDTNKMITDQNWRNK